jgi:hypothetical protein
VGIFQWDVRVFCGQVMNIYIYLALLSVPLMMQIGVGQSEGLRIGKRT